MFVSGPVGTSVTGSGRLTSVIAIQSIACAGSGGRDVVAADVIENPDGIRGRLLERLIAGDRGDPEQVQLGAAECQEERDRVVVAGVAVEDDVGHAIRVRTGSASSLAHGAPVRRPSPDPIPLEPMAVARAHAVALAGLDEIAGVSAALANCRADRGA